MGYQWFGTCRPAQLIMCVTLLAHTNSRSCLRRSHLRSHLVADEKPILDLDSPDELALPSGFHSFLYEFKVVPQSLNR